MFWQVEEPGRDFPIPDDVVDLSFQIDCRELPVDHAFDLACALRESAPWIAEDDRIGIHTVHLAGSQNGWERPDPGSGQLLMLSRRTKLSIRVPRERIDALQEALYGIELDIGGCPMIIGKGKIRPLSSEPTIFSRQVVSEDDDEDRFLEWAADELSAMGIRIRKALCGKTRSLNTPEGAIRTRSLMLADLPVQESVRLQQQGLGALRMLGCGIFIPHKDISAAREV